MQAYEVYVEDGRYYPIGIQTRVKGRRRGVLTLFDEPVAVEVATKPTNELSETEMRAIWAEIKELCKNVDPNIDEKKELAEYREEKYGRID